MAIMLVFSLRTSLQEKGFDELVLSENGRKAYQILLKIGSFAVGGLGYGGERISDGEKALRILLEEKESAAAFKSLLKDAEPEGGLYALVGLRWLKCDCFEKEYNAFLSKPDPQNRNEFQGMSFRAAGCTGFLEERVKAAEAIRNGAFDSDMERYFSNKKQGKF